MGAIYGGGGGGGGGNVAVETIAETFIGDALPEGLTLHPYSFEAGDLLPSGWETFDPGSMGLTATSTTNGVHVELPHPMGTGDHGIAGLVFPWTQADGDFSMIAKVVFLGNEDETIYDTYYGVGRAAGLTATDPINGYFARHDADGTADIEARGWSDWTTLGSSRRIDHFDVLTVYFAVRYDASSNAKTYFASMDGQSWMVLDRNGDTTGLTDYFGVFIGSGYSDTRMRIQYVRIVEEVYDPDRAPYHLTGRMVPVQEVTVGAAAPTPGEEQYAGFQDYNDTSTSAVPISLDAGVWTDVPNDGAGMFTNTAYYSGSEVLLDTGTGAINPVDMDLGDHLIIRNDVRITPSVNGSFVEFRYKLGAGANEYTLTNLSRSLSDGAREYALLWNSMIYAGDTNSRDNPITLQVRCSSNATFTNLGSAIILHRK